MGMSLAEALAVALALVLSPTRPDTVAIIFTNDVDLSLWRQSPRRNTWLESGVERGLALNEASMLIANPSPDPDPP